MTDKQPDPPRPSGEQPLPAWDAPQAPMWDAPPQPPAWDRGAPSGGAAAWGPPPVHDGSGSALQGYGYGPVADYRYGGYGPPQNSGKAVAALVFAIVSFAVFPLIPAIVSLVLAGQAKRDIALSGGRLGGAGMVTAAKVVSWLNIALSVAFGALIAVVVAYAATYSGTTF